MNIYELTHEYEIYLRDESRSIGHAASISFPENEAEMREIISRMNAGGTPVTIQGGRTGLAAGAVPYGGHVMNLSKMDQLLDVTAEAGRYYFTVRPGMVLANLRKIIAGRKIDPEQMRSGPDAALAFINDREYFFPTDPTETSATIGGIAACNASGARSYKFGAARNHITRIRMILADGRIADIRRGEVSASGRRLVLPLTDGSSISAEIPSYQMPACKNASGYFACHDMDAVDLLIGSDGTLGAISEIEIELLPLPAYIWGVSCFLRDEDIAVRLTNALRDGFRNLAAIEYFDKGALDILREQKRKNTAFSALPALKKEYSCCIYAEIQEEDESAALQTLLQIGECLTACGGREEDTWVARSDTDRETQQFFRHAVPESVNMLIDERKKTDPSITKLAGDMAVPDEYLAEVMHMYRETLAAAGLQSAVWGHMGNNHLHVNILPRDSRDYGLGKQLIAGWAEKVTTMGGAVSAEHGVGKLKRDFLAIMYGSAHIEEMAALKKAFDPKGIFGRGNLFAAEVMAPSAESMAAPAGERETEAAE